MAAGRVQELQQKLDALQGEQAALLSQIATIVQQAVAVRDLACCAATAPRAATQCSWTPPCTRLRTPH